MAEEKAVTKKAAAKKVEEPDAPIFYEEYGQVQAVEHYDYNDFSQFDTKRQEMVGFDPKYNDFVDYIMTITHEIWEEHGIGVIYDTYHNNVSIHSAAQNFVGIQGVIAGTLSTLYSFPDRKLIGQDVLWSKHGKEGYMSSHRIISTATNLNDSSFGPATGKKVNFRTTVDCAAEHNRIYEEWLVRDNLWIVKQLGYDPVEVAKRMAASEPKDELRMTNIGKDENFIGQLFPIKYEPKDDSLGEWVKALFLRIYNGRRFNEVRDYYAEEAVIHYICDKDLHGHNKIQGMLTDLFASFPNASFAVERITVNEAKDPDTYDVAVRWRLSGLNEGLGFFGKPTGQPVEILGINHLKMVNKNVVEEWMTYDGLDVLRQIHAGSSEADETDASQE